VESLAGGQVKGDAVEFGCGYGTFTIVAAPRIGGIVYALDIDSYTWPPSSRLTVGFMLFRPYDVCQEMPEDRFFQKARR
jgi:hypothetical protein